MAIQSTTQENLTPKEILDNLTNAIGKIENIELQDITTMIKEGMSVETYTNIYTSFDAFFHEETGTGTQLIDQLKKFESIDKDLISSFREIASRYKTLKNKFSKLPNIQDFTAMKANHEIIEKYTPIISELKTKIQTLQNYQNNEEKQPTNISYQEYKNAYNEIKNQLNEIQRAINGKKVGILMQDYNALVTIFNTLKPQQTEYLKINTTRKASGWSDIELSINQITTIEIKSFIGKGTNGTDYYEVSIPEFTENFIMRVTREGGANNLWNLWNSEIGVVKMPDDNNMSLVNYIEISENSHQFQDIEIEGSKGLGTLFMDQDLNPDDISSMMQTFDTVKSWYKEPKEK